MLRKIKLTTYIILAFLCICSCETEDFLEKAPGVDTTEDVVFSSMDQTLTAVSGMYLSGIYSGYPSGYITSPPKEAMLASASDESDAGNDGTWTQPWNRGTITPVGNNDPHYNDRWEAIRKANIILERIDGVPGATKSFKDQVTGEALFIRALNYHYFFYRYGGMPIIDFRPVDPKDASKPRSSIKSTVDFIIKDCDRAISLLPNFQPPEWRGRATKGSALALKSRTLLYAASPLFNSATPHISLGDADSLIVYGSFDINRWKLAADAAKEVLDWAPSAGIGLVNDRGVDQNYRAIWEETQNEEIIFADQKSIETVVGAYWPWFGLLPGGTGFFDYGSQSVTFNFQARYEKKDGTRQTWDFVNGGDDLNQKYEELDPRFAQTIAYNGSYFNIENQNISTFVGGTHDVKNSGGAWMLKWCPSNAFKFNRIIVEWPVFRLGEFYLNYAEAINEFQGPTTEAYEAVNTIRRRSGMPDVPSGLSQEEFRTRIRNERGVELAFEEHRLWDVLRWKIAQDKDFNGLNIMDGDMMGIKINPIEGTDPQEFSYTPYVFEKRTFPLRMYLTPFPQDEINKGNLIQNPGY